MVNPRMVKEGDKAPDFALDADDGSRVSLGDFRGKYLVLYFYPKDSTPGCTREAQEFTAEKKRFEKAGAVVVGVSKDSVKSHCSFRDKYKLSIPLASDPDLAVHNAYGAYGDKMMYGKKIKGTIRSTFVIGPKGNVARVFSPVKVDGHAEKVLEAIAEASGGSAAPKGSADKKAAAANASAKAAAPKKRTSTGRRGGK